jgi:hypothetical protein
MPHQAYTCQGLYGVYDSALGSGRWWLDVALGSYAGSDQRPAMETHSGSGRWYERLRG